MEFRLRARGWITLIKDMFRTLVSFWARIQRAAEWVLTMTAEERRNMQQRAVGVVACASAAAYGAPVIADHAASEKDLEAFRANATQLAEALAAERDGEDMIAALDLSRPWRQQVSYAPSEAQDVQTIAPTVELQNVVDVLAGLAPRDPKAALEQRMDHHCMAQAIYYEARSESVLGQMAVAEVVLNRVDSHFYPDNVCDVVYEGSHRRTGCQFSFTCDGSMNKAPRGEAWDRSREVAAAVLMEDMVKPVTGGATHYHTDYVSPYWRVGLIRTNVIDTHIFYRFPETGREWAKVQVAKAAYRASRSSTPVLTDVAVSAEDLMAKELARLDREV